MWVFVRRIDWGRLDEPARRVDRAEWAVRRTVYTQLKAGLPGALTLEGLTPRRARWPTEVGKTVILLGLTSLFTDISSEMVSTVLPLYLVFHLSFTPFQLGVVDGLYQGVAALVRVLSGFSADRWKRHKEVAVLGYGLSAACKVGLLAVGSTWGGLISMILVDRVGKGIRTAPRDALISLSTDPAHLGMAFGVHRALDTLGALLGPLFAFALLSIVVDGYDAVFVASFCAAVIGLGILSLFVENRPSTDGTRHAAPVSLMAAVGLANGRSFWLLVIGGTVLSLATVSDAFLYLALQRRVGLAEGLFPLLFVVTSLVYFMLAVPAGRLADRLGRGRLLLGGYALLPLVYLVLLLPTVGYVGLFACLVLFGAYYAATDGVLMALASSVLPTETRTSGLGLLTTATSVGRLFASVAFGALWSWWSMEAAVVTFTVSMLAAILLAAALFARLNSAARHVPSSIG